MRESSYCFSAS